MIADGSTQDVFAADYVLATRTDTLFLGVLKDTEVNQLYSANATGDNLDNLDDERTVDLAALPRLTVVSTGNYDVPVTCHLYRQRIHAWLD